MRISCFFVPWSIAGGGVAATQIPLSGYASIGDREGPKSANFLDGEFRGFAEETLKHFHTPGVSIGVVKDNKTFSAVRKIPS